MRERSSVTIHTPVFVKLGGGIVYGPEIYLHGKEGHWRALHDIFETIQSKSEGSLTIFIKRQEDGQLAQAGEVKAGVHSCSFSKKANEGHFYIDIPMDMIVGSEERFRQRMAEYLRDGTRQMVEYLERKKVPIDAAEVISRVDSMVNEYLALPLPIPADPKSREIWTFLEKARETAETMKDEPPSQLVGPIKVSFYTYFKRESRAKAFARGLDPATYRSDISESEDEWLCVAELVVNTDDDFDRAEQEIGLLALTHGGQLDGWEYG